jgi:hypothetical protein
MGASDRAWLKALILAIAIAVPGRPAVAEGAAEYEVKAAYLYKLGEYVQWPASAFAQPASPVSICIAGDDPFGNILETNVASEHIGSRPIAIRRLKTIEQGSGCHIAYLGGSAQQSVDEALASVRGAPVLTITDSERKSAATGIVHFIVKANRVRFDIDDQAAAQNGLQISSKLLSLASSVKPRK